MIDFMCRVFKERRPASVTAVSLWSGGLVWGGYLVLDVLSQGLHGAWIERLFLLAPLVVLPIALSICLEASERGKETLYKAAIWLQPVAAFGLTAAFVFRRPALTYLPDLPGLAVYLTVPWLVFCVLLLLGEVLYVWRMNLTDRTDLLLMFPVLFLQVGGFWLMIDQMDIVFMGITAPIRLLTAVHFHFTGFGVPVLLAGLHALFLRNRWERQAYRTMIAAGGVVVGIPMVAIGFVHSNMVKTTGVVLLSLSMVFAAVLLFQSGRFMKRSYYTWCVRLAAGCVVMGMILAVIFQVTLHLRRPVLSIPLMTVTHGVLNGLGFMIPGLIGIRHGLKTHQRGP